MKAKIWSKSGWIKETNPESLKFLGEGLLKESGFEIVGYSEHYYKPFGFSVVWLITESHFTFHTFPEEGLTYWELSSCNKNKFDYLIKKI